MRGPPGRRLQRSSAGGKWIGIAGGQVHAWACLLTYFTVYQMGQVHADPAGSSTDDGGKSTAAGSPAGSQHHMHDPQAVVCSGRRELDGAIRHLLKLQ